MPMKINRKQIKIPEMRRQYETIFGLDGGLDYSKPTTAIGNKFTPSCSEVLFRRGTVAKAKGTQPFGGTDVLALDGTVMHIHHFYQANENNRLVLHTTKQVYAYNASSGIFETITNGLVVDDCEDVWTAVGTATTDVTTDARKGSKSMELTIPAGFTTGVAAYENHGSLDISDYTHIHFYIKSSINLASADLILKISDEVAAGEGGNFEDLVIPALVAGEWTEISLAIGTPGNYSALLSVSLQVDSDEGACVIDMDDVLAITEKTGDEDDVVVSEVNNNYYIANNGIAPIEYWDMSTTNPMKVMAGGTTLATKKIGKLGERVVLFHVIDTGTVFSQRVQWTVVGGLAVPTPLATDWSNPGSGNADLESTMGTDPILTAEKIGSYYAIYGERTIVLMDYTGRVSNPFAFYTRVTNKGLAAERAIANLGNYHIYLGWDDVYLYRGGKDVERIGERIKVELFSIISPSTINRCFMSFDEFNNEIRLYYPTTADTTPTKYFAYNIDNKSWSRGVRSYTGFGYYTKLTSDTWDSIGDDANATWNEQPTPIRWDDVTLEALSSIKLFGTVDGTVQQDDETTNNLIGVAIDGVWETKDFVVGKRYRETLTNWMELNFEARGNTVDVAHSTDQGVTYSAFRTISITAVWKRYGYDFNANSELIRFKFRNNTLGESWEARMLELGYVPASNRGK